MESSDIEDAYQVALVMAGIEDDSEERRFRKEWEKATAKAQRTTIDFAEAEKVKRSYHGRTVPDNYLHNTLILGRTINGRLVALDGSHRLRQHLEKQSPVIACLIIDISWIDGAEDMEYDLP